MRRSGDNRQLGLSVFVLTVIGLAIFVLTLDRHRIGAVQVWAWILLGGVAFAAELLPVEIARRGVRITLGLPFIAGVAIAISPSAAMMTDVIVTILVGISLSRRRRVPTSALWIGANAAISLFSAGVGAAVLLAISGSVIDPYLHSILGGLSFIFSYAAMNLLAVTWVEHVTTERGWNSVLTDLRIGAAGLLLYLFVGLAVCVLVTEQLWILIPLALLPVWMLRTGLAYQAKMYDNYCDTITALTVMLHRAHPYTHGHLERVANTAELVARRLGLSATRAKLVREAAVLHDIGKIAVDEEILDKPGKLTPDELAHVRLHSLWGAEILEPAEQFKPLVEWIKYHHERPDGTGYPERLADSAIPIESKIIAVVDAYDAMIGETASQRRAYREPMTSDQALEELSRFAGTQFDPKVVAVFTDICHGGGHP